MIATYHKQLQSPYKNGDVLPKTKLRMFDFNPSFIEEYKIDGNMWCTLDSNSYYLFLYLENGDRIDIRH